MTMSVSSSTKIRTNTTNIASIGYLMVRVYWRQVRGACNRIFVIHKMMQTNLISILAQTWVKKTSLKKFEKNQLLVDIIFLALDVVKSTNTKAILELHITVYKTT